MLEHPKSSLESFDVLLPLEGFGEIPLGGKGRSAGTGIIAEQVALVALGTRSTSIAPRPAFTTTGAAG